MPRSFSSSTLVLLSIFAFGCSTTMNKSEVGQAVYRESSADVVNRAPNSMSLPGGDAASSRAQADYHFSLAETYSLEGNSVRAIEEFKLTLIYDPDSAPVHVRLAAEYVKQGLVSEAMDQAKLAIERDPQHTDAHLLLGGLYSALHMYDDALKEYRAVLAYQTDNYDAPLFIGALLAEQKKFAEAAHEFEALAKNPNNPNTHIALYYLGRVRLEEKKDHATARAEAAFHQSLEVKPGYSEATLALGQLLETTNRQAGAKALYQSYQEKYGPSATVAEELARIYIEEKDYARAYDQLAVMESSDPSDINVKAKMAFILIEQQKYPDAIKRLEDVLALEPSSDKIRFYLAVVYEEIKDYGSAITHFEKVPSSSSYYAESIVHAAYLYKLNGNYSKAIATVEQGIKAKDDHPPFYALYASLLDDQKQYKKAAAMLTDAVKKFPDSAQLFFFLGNMQDHLGDKEATLSSMRHVLEIDKDHVQALNFLAYTYAESGTQLDEAEKLARRALELQPGDGYIMDTYGWVLFKKGAVDEAIRVLEAAYKIQPNESVIAEHLGDAYYHQQMPEKAKRLYMRAAETESNVAMVEKIRQKIASVDRQRQDQVPPQSSQPAQSGDGIQQDTDQARKPASAAH